MIWNKCCVWESSSLSPQKYLQHFLWLIVHADAKELTWDLWLLNAIHPLIHAPYLPLELCFPVVSILLSFPFQVCGCSEPVKDETSQCVMIVWSEISHLASRLCLTSLSPRCRPLQTLFFKKTRTLALLHTCPLYRLLRKNNNNNDNNNLHFYLYGPKSQLTFCLKGLDNMYRCKPSALRLTAMAETFRVFA